MANIQAAIVLLTIAVVSICSPSARAQSHRQPDLMSDWLQLGKKLQDDGTNILDKIFHELIPKLIGQTPNNVHGERKEFKEICMKDDSNDDAINLEANELIARSGFGYETYDAIADDGYITVLTRIINPRVDRRKLRQPPLLLEHGASIDPTIYLTSSSIEHFPEKWPRNARDGPIRSSNRSLGFYLANHGFDVWLAETRGSTDKNRRHIKTMALESALLGKNGEKNLTVAEQLNAIRRQLRYWDFSQDDVIANEIKSHMDKVMEVTGCSKVSLFAYSLSTPASLAFLSVRPDYAERIQGYVLIAPIVSGAGRPWIVELISRTICAMTPDLLGTLVLTDIVLTPPMRHLFVALSRDKQIRYSVMKGVLSYLFGSSAKYQTLLELNLLGHFLKGLSFRHEKQLCQQANRDRLQKFDYGPIKNQLLYKSPTPPIYDISSLNIDSLMIVSAENDAMATPQAVRRLIAQVNPKPAAYLRVKGYNHMDLIAGVDVDRRVNKPILKYLEHVSSRHDRKGSGSRALLNLESIILEKHPEDRGNYTVDVRMTEANGNMIAIDDPFLKGVQNLINATGIEKMMKELQVQWETMVQQATRAGPRPTAGVKDEVQSRKRE